MDEIYLVISYQIYIVEHGGKMVLWMYAEVVGGGGWAIMRKKSISRPKIMDYSRFQRIIMVFKDFLCFKNNQIQSHFSS